jgi:hypothetical protein
MTITDATGYVAAGLVLATFCAQQMAPLRALAISSNLAFITYGLAAQLWPILILHAIMLPLNIARLRRALASPRLQRRADNGVAAFRLVRQQCRGALERTQPARLIGDLTGLPDSGWPRCRQGAPLAEAAMQWPWCRRGDLQRAGPRAN